MPNLTKKPNKPEISGSMLPAITFERRILLLCALILCSAVIFIAYRQAHSTAATPQGVPQAIPPAITSQAPVNAPTAPAADKLATTPSIWPVAGAVTSGFGMRTFPLGGGDEFHAGVDIAVDTGTPVVATADGQVIKSGMAGGYGNMVEIAHGNNLATVYGHNSRLAVSVGQNVKKGQVISYSGSTGESTGPHVHYEVRENGTAIDPWKYLVSY